jgi:ABC-2 type transport system permease protein
MAVMVLKNKKVANALIQTLIPVMTFISGGYARFVSENPVYNAIKFLMPSNLAHTAFFNSIYGEFSGQTVSSVLVLWVMTAVMFGIAVLFGRRRLA